MQTQLLSATPQAVHRAAQLLQNGEVVGIPTETVYGLAANATNAEAVQRIFNAKGRPQDNPLIVHIASMDMLERLAKDIPPAAYKLAEKFWPGPLTMVLPHQDSLAPQVSAGLDTVGIRMPSHPVARSLIEQCGLPLAAPSANRSGSPSPTTATHVMNDMQGLIPLVLDGGACEVGLESTVICFTQGDILVLRPGVVTQQQLADAAACNVQLVPQEQAIRQNIAPKSPGMKYRHYAPKATVVLVDASDSEFISYVKQQQTQQGIYALCYSEDISAGLTQAVSFGSKNSPASQAEQLFSALRRLDELGASLVYARLPSENGISLAVRNRLLRAAEFRVVRPQHKQK